MPVPRAGACVEVCPVLINPMEVILELRRNEILSQSKGPANWTAMFNSLKITIVFGQCLKAECPGRINLYTRMEGIKHISEYISNNEVPEIPILGRMCRCIRCAS